MEKRRLNFDAPILSTRRHSLPSTPTNQGGLNEVKNPFAVGQEPNRRNKAEQEIEKVTTPGNVPFLWEQSPGRPKGEVESPGYVPGFSRSGLEERFYGHNTHRLQTDPYSLSDCDVLLEKFKKALSCKDEPHSECGDGERSDGAEALSQSESGGVNNSSSGLSSTVKSSGAFKVDEQTRDYIMRRFLPAAKAAVLEKPEHDEQPKHARKEVFEEPMPLRYRYSPSPLLDKRCPDPYPCHSKLIDHMESQAAIKKFAVPFKKKWKAIPRLFAKNSLCLLKPRLGSKLRSLTPPPTSEVKSLTRKALSGPLDRNSFHQFLKKKIQSGFLPRELRGVEYSTQFGSRRDSIHSKLSPMRRYSSGSLSPNRNEAPKSPLRYFRSANVSPFRNEVPKSPMWDYQSAHASPYRNEAPKSPYLNEAPKSPYRNEAPKSPLRDYGTATGLSTFQNELPRSLLMDYQSANVSPFQNEPPKSPLRGYQSAKSSPNQDEPEPPKPSMLPKSPLSRYESLYSFPVRNEARYQWEFSPVSEKADKHNVGRFTRSQELHRPLPDVRRIQMCELASSGPLGSSSPLADAKEKTLYVDTINLPIPKSPYRGSGLPFNFERDDVFAGEEGKRTCKLGSTKNVVHSSETFAPDTFYFADSKGYTNWNRGHDRPLRTLEKCIREKERDPRSAIRGSDHPAKIHMPPQLPKMPSQSWLSQANESAATGHTSPQSRRTIYPKLQGQKGSIPDPKWEFLVKTSDALGCDHRRYSGELPPSYRKSKPYGV